MPNVEKAGRLVLTVYSKYFSVLGGRYTEVLACQNSTTFKEMRYDKQRSMDRFILKNI